jgi:hypothetical protein
MSKQCKYFCINAQNTRAIRGNAYLENFLDTEIKRKNNQAGTFFDKQEEMPR